MGVCIEYCICDVCSITFYEHMQVVLGECCAFDVLEFKSLWGHDLYACRVNNLLDYGEALGKEGLKEF